MFCQQCGKFLPESNRECEHCGHNQERSRISNKALILAGIAAIISVGSALLSFLPDNKPINAKEPIAVASPSSSVAPTPRSSPTLKPTQKPRPTPEPTLEPTTTTNYPYRHRLTLLSPDDGALFSYRYALGRLVLRWRRNSAPEVDRYKVTIEYGNPSHLPPWMERDIETPWDYCTVEFIGAPVVDFSGRWRVTPIFADGRLGLSTEWRTFRFIQ